MNSPPASEPLTASMFISLQDAEKAATSKPTMWVMTPDGKSTMEIPMPASVTESGKVPVGFSIGTFHFIGNLASKDACIRLGVGPTHSHFGIGFNRHYNHRVCIQFPPYYCPSKTNVSVQSASTRSFREFKGRNECTRQPVDLPDIRF